MRLAFLFILSFFMANDKTLGQSRQIDLQGHRGCRGLMPENTIPAMIEAIRLGVTTLELDVVISKDGLVVVSHEPFMNPEISTPPAIADKQLNEEVARANMYQMTYAEIKKWDVGLKKNERFPNQLKIPVYKPLLSSLIDSVELYILSNKLKPVKYNIETKSSPSTDGIYHPAPKEFVELLMQVLTEKNILAKTTIQSFDKRTLQYVHHSFPFMQTSFLIGGEDIRSIDALVDDLGFKPDIISPEFGLIDKTYVVDCHKKGIKVIAWTVNDRSKIIELAKMHVDGIISDYPNMFDVLRPH